MKSMKNHKYWGEVEEDWAGFSAEILFDSEYFDNKEITIFLGSEFDDDGEEIEIAPNESELYNFENTYKKFLDDLDKIIEEINHYGLKVHSLNEQTQSRPLVPTPK